MPPVLLADLFDLIQAALPLLFAVGWGLWQMVSAMQGAAKPERRPARAPGPQQGDNAPPAGKAAGQQGDLRSEVDEFLRRLKDPNADAPEKRPEQQRAEQQRPPQQPPQRPTERKKPRRPRIEVLVDDDPQQVEPPPRVADRPRRSGPQSSGQERRPSKPKQRPQPAKSSLAEQAAHLGEKVAQADEAIEVGVHEKFDHALGSLASADDAYGQDSPAGESSSKKEGKPDAAASIAAMLRDPENVRNAVILNEILRRPAI